mgnify:CR=1 FL=1
MSNALKLSLSFIISLVLLLAIAYGTGLMTSPAQNDPAYGLEETLAISTADGEAHWFDLYIAATPEEIRTGLMGKDYLAPNKGMLFVFGKEELRRFWMKNTRIPLDMLFIRANGSIRHIHKNATPLDETLIESNGPVLAVLEINGGRSTELGIKVGDNVHHSLFGTKISR